MDRLLVTEFYQNGVCTFLENKERIFAIIDGNKIQSNNITIKINKLVN
jgi:hypothetical protein